MNRIEKDPTLEQLTDPPTASTPSLEESTLGRIYQKAGRRRCANDLMDRVRCLANRPGGQVRYRHLSLALCP